MVYRFTAIFLVWYGSAGGVDGKIESGIVSCRSVSQYIVIICKSSYTNFLVNTTGS